MFTSELNAVIFDMDGVLIDSEPIASRVVTGEARRFGAELTPDVLEASRGMLGRDFWASIKSRYNLPEPVQYYIDHFNVDLEIAEYSPAIISPGSVNLMTELRKASIRTALATSASKRRMEAVLEIMDWTDTFDAVVCGADVKNGKPDPEVFWLAAERLGMAPENCLVIEDSGRGIRAALAAGMVAVGYTGLGATAESLAEAHHIVSDFRDVSVDLLRSIWSRHR